MQLRRVSISSLVRPTFEHPNGWKVRCAQRSWALKGLIPDCSTRLAPHCPDVWWEILVRGLHVGGIVHDTRTLAEATDWCNRHVPKVPVRIEPVELIIEPPLPVALAAA